jgi:hypothetical protein
MPTAQPVTYEADLDIQEGQPLLVMITVEDGDGAAVTVSSTVGAEAKIEQWYESAVTAIATLTVGVSAGKATLALTKAQVDTMKTAVEAVSGYAADTTHRRILIGQWWARFPLPAPFSDVFVIGQGNAYLRRI